MINVKALRATMEKVELAAKRKGVQNAWNQNVWRSDTGMCFAGHGIALAGLLWIDPNLSSFDPHVRHPEWGVGFCDDAMVYFYGLTRAESVSLFHVTNTLDDLRQMVAAIEVIAAMDQEAIL